MTASGDQVFIGWDVGGGNSAPTFGVHNKEVQS